MAGSETEGQLFSGFTTRIRRSIAAAGSKRGLVTLALLTSMTVAALEQTVVSTAMPSIIATLNGLEIYPWVFSAYLLAATVSTPLYGKLADRLGRKRVLLFGLGAFTLGSILSGLARSMPELIAMRVIQGLGAGAVGPIVITMLGDLFTLEERAKVQGLFSGVWGVSSLAGPAVGGVLTDWLSWRWVFFVTAPFALLAIWILATRVEEPPRHPEHRKIDWLGSFLLSSGTAALLLAVLRGDDQTIAGGVLLGGLAVALLVTFAWQETRAEDPILPIDLFLTPNILAAVTGSFLLGAALFALDTYVPLYVQGVRGGTATQAGRAITPLFLSWSLSVAVAARFIRPLGFRRTATAGASFITIGTAGLAIGSLFPRIAGPIFLVSMAVIGLGMGPAALSYTLDVQNSVAYDRRGTATGAVIFSRTIGGALGVGLLGAALGVRLAGRLVGTTGIDVAAALRPETHDRLTPENLQTVRLALGGSIREVFVMMTCLGALAFVASLGLRGGPAVSHADSGRAPSQPQARRNEEIEVDLAAAVEH
ncbi:MAG: MDR family MFS transporter [Isosphaeraceae bacterium]